MNSTRNKWITLFFYLCAIIGFAVSNFVFDNGLIGIILFTGFIALRGILSVICSELRNGVVFFAIIEGISFCVFTRIFPILFV